ncbi:MAG: macrolide family glycosyltransferase [Pseudonocardiaceae bacterium]
MCDQNRDSVEKPLRKHFGFVNVPAAGHINPTLPLVEELVRRGHRVSYATGHSMLARVEAVGAEPVPLPTGIFDPKLLANVDLFHESLARTLEHFIADAQNTFPHLFEHFEHDRPDAVCYDGMAFAGRVLADKLAIPGISLIPHFAGHENFSLREQFKHPRFVDFCRSMAEFTAEHGLTTDLQPMGGSPSPLNLVFIPRRFQIAAGSFDERFCFLGPSLGQRADEQWQPRHGDAPLLFISLGTVFNDRPEFYQMCFEAFGNSHWQVAMAVGDHVDMGEFEQAPENFEVRRSFPQPAVLRHATAFLTHAGMNSTMESLYYAVPLVAVPQMFEQSLNARRVEQLGLGRRLGLDQLTAKRLRAAVDQAAADENVRANLTTMQHALHDCGGAVAGADALEAHLSDHRGTRDVTTTNSTTASARGRVSDFHRFMIDTGRGRIAGLRTYPSVENGFRRAVITVGGLADKKERWAALSRKIARAGYDVCSYDHLGLHESDGPDCSAYYTIESMADDLLSVVDQMVSSRDSIHLVGFCFGGFVARELAARFPHRVRSLVLLGSGLSMSSSCAPAFHEQVEEGLAGGGADWMFDKVREAALQAGISHRTMERFRGSFRAPQAGFIAGFSRAVAEYRVCEIRPDLPILVVHGSADDVWAAPTQQVMADQLGAQLAVIEGAGHYTGDTHPTATADTLMRFWQHVELQARVPVPTP